MFGSPRFLIWILLASAAIVGAIAALAIGKWWIIFIPLAVHGIGTALVTMGFFKRLNQGDKPDPVTEARLEEEGDKPLI
jgi:membrane protein implicated in regulation of membrane protease activity